MSEERVRIEIADHIAVVTMVRADKHNALDIAMFEGLVDAAARLRSEFGVRAVVLHGDGPSFCSGIDVVSVMSAQANGTGPLEPSPDDSSAAPDPERERGSGRRVGGLLEGDVPNWFQRAAYGWIEVPVPVIAAVHGNCLGGGLQIALAADIRICAPDARLSVMELNWGLIPDMAITRTLPRLVGSDVAKELTYTARVFNGEEAARLGVVTRLADDPLTAARELATEIAARSPDAVRSAKRLYDEAWTGDADATLALEARLQLELIGSPNQLAAATAALTKQPGEFTDPD